MMAQMEKEEVKPVMAQMEKEEVKPVMAQREKEKEKPVMAQREKEKEKPVMAQREKEKEKPVMAQLMLHPVMIYNPYICSWERRQHLGPSPVAPPNPDRFVARGFAASQRRLQRRQLARDGKTVPEHLQPRKVEISKSLKRQMWELQQRARKMACGELTEEDLLEEEEKKPRMDCHE